MFFNSSRKISLFLLILYAVAVYSSSDFDQNVHLFKEFVAARQVYVYKAYKDMQIFHFNIPSNTARSVFNLTSNTTDGCTPRNITVYLQADSYPVVSPDGAKFPEHAWVSRQPVYQATLLSDLTPAFLRIKAPQPGDWFLVAFIFDDSNRITQAGIFPSCYSWLQVEASYYQENNIEILETQVQTNETLELSQFRIQNQTYFSFFVPSDIWSGIIVISNCRQIIRNNSSEEVLPVANSSCPVSVILRPLALPFPGAPESVWRNCSIEEFQSCSLPFTPVPSTWHYVLVIPTEKIVSFEIGVSLNVCDCESDLLNVKFRSPFVLEEEFVLHAMAAEEKISKDLFNTSSNQSNFNEDVFNISKTGLISVKFEEELIPENNFTYKDWHIPLENDIKKRRSIQVIEMESENAIKDPVEILEGTKRNSCGTNYILTRRTFPGNFVFEFDLKPNGNGTVPLMLNLSNQWPTVLSFDVQSIIDIGGTLSVDIALSPFTNTTLHNSTVYGCLNLRIRPSIEYTNGDVICSRGHMMQVNSSDPVHYSSSVLIPYPEPGRWFYTLFPSCYSQNQSNFIPCSTNVTTVIFSIASASCVLGKCGEYGSCFQYISGGFIFSTCVCDVGYRGYDCSDGSEAIPNWKLLTSTLLLCLSNLFFLPAIILALYRKFYTEAVVYGFTMFFSTFYHACDQNIYKFCLIRLNVLQFCDFYSAILSFWVTLIVMANLPHHIYSILHMAGAMTVALGVEYDKTGLWVFAIPSISALIIMCIAWIIHTQREKTCYPPKRYWIRSLVPGTALAITGLISYAFLETEDNYYLIHSMWHAIMALSILCLLPSRTKDNSKDSSVEDGEFQVSEAQALTVNLNM